jgi:hypothetical protein
MTPEQLKTLFENGTVTQLAHLLARHEITLVIEYGGATGYLHDPALPNSMRGMMPIAVEEIPCVINDKDSFLAKYYGVPVELYRRWKEAHINGPRCWALTGKGIPCRSQMIAKEDKVPEHPSQFEPDKAIYCATHRDHSANVQNSK